MDPQSLAFTPRDDIWRFQSDLLRLQQTQTEQGERLMRVERRLEDDARMKSVWGTSSPFPGVLSGTPQQGTWKCVVYADLLSDDLASRSAPTPAPG